MPYLHDLSKWRSAPEYDIIECRRHAPIDNRENPTNIGIRYGMPIKVVPSAMQRANKRSGVSFWACEDIEPTATIDDMDPEQAEDGFFLHQLDKRFEIIR